MTTMFDLESTATFYAPGSATFAAPSKAFDDLTVASAWSASPLGDPSVEDGSLFDLADFEADFEAPDFEDDSEDFEPDRPVPAAKQRSFGKNTLFAAVVVGAIGGGVALGVMIAGRTGPEQPKPAVVVSDASVGSVTPRFPPHLRPVARRRPHRKPPRPALVQHQPGRAGPPGVRRSPVERPRAIPDCGRPARRACRPRLSSHSRRQCRCLCRRPGEPAQAAIRVAATQAATSLVVTRAVATTATRVAAIQAATRAAATTVAATRAIETRALATKAETRAATSVVATKATREALTCLASTCLASTCLVATRAAQTKPATNPATRAANRCRLLASNRSRHTTDTEGWGRAMPGFEPGLARPLFSKSGFSERMRTNGGTLNASVGPRDAHRRVIGSNVDDRSTT